MNFPLGAHTVFGAFMGGCFVVLNFTLRNHLLRV